MTLLTSSPGKYVWSAIAVLITLVKLPLAALYFIPKSTRPHPEWTVFQSVMNAAMNSFLYHLATVQGVTRLDLQPGNLGDRYESVAKAPKAIVVGAAASDNSTVPMDTGVIWFPTRPSTMTTKNKLVVLHFHPGGYVMYVLIQAQPSQRTMCLCFPSFPWNHTL